MKKTEIIESKYIIICSILILFSFLFFLFSKSYALFTKQFLVSDVDLKVGELNYSFISEALENDSITVEAGKSISFDVTIKSLNTIDSKYELYYNSDQEGDLIVGYLTSSEHPISGEIGKNELRTITIKISNKSNNSKVVRFGVEGGFINNDLILSKGEKLAEIDEVPVSKKVFAEENLGENCSTHNDGVETFLVGQCKNNYVWYSGKLWRVVLKNNETGIVKMVTDNAITTLSQNNALNTVYENSYIDQWLTQEFLPTLYDYENYVVVNNEWDLTPRAMHNLVNKLNRPSSLITINRTIGLLSDYEYLVTFLNSGGLSTYSTGYLMNNSACFVITPYKSTSATSTTNFIQAGGYYATSLLTNFLGIRPSINLQSKVTIINGKGTLDNPYNLMEENNINETLLNTRYSGEYVKFNNELYRIVDIENSVTKVISVNHSLSLGEKEFDLNSTNFNQSSLKNNLESYYQSLSEPVRMMIEPNTIWYLGTISSGINYKAGICASVDANISSKDCKKVTTIATANIGIPRVGEMFASQITREERKEFWLLNASSSSLMTFITTTNEMGYSRLSSKESKWVRPSFYLKSSVVISKDNTGNGTYEYPYELELGA